MSLCDTKCLLPAINLSPRPTSSPATQGNVLSLGIDLSFPLNENGRQDLVSLRWGPKIFHQKQVLDIYQGPDLLNAIELETLRQAKVAVVAAIVGNFEVICNSSNAVLFSGQASPLAQVPYTFPLQDGMTLITQANKTGPKVTVTFRSWQFQNISAATPAEIALVIKSGLDKVFAEPFGARQIPDPNSPPFCKPRYIQVPDDQIRLSTYYWGEGAELRILGGSANDILKFRTPGILPTQATMIGREGPYSFPYEDPAGLILNILFNDALQMPVQIFGTQAVTTGVAGVFPTTFEGGEGLSLVTSDGIKTVVFTSDDQTLSQVIARINSALRVLDPLANLMLPIVKALDQDGELRLVEQFAAGTSSSFEILGDANTLDILGLSPGTYSGTGSVPNMRSVTSAEILALLQTNLLAQNITEAEVLLDSTLRPALRSLRLGDTGSILVATGEAAQILGFSPQGEPVFGDPGGDAWSTGREGSSVLLRGISGISDTGVVLRENQEGKVGGVLAFASDIGDLRYLGIRSLDTSVKGKIYLFG